jgi:hypothetical protein
MNRKFDPSMIAKRVPKAVLKRTQENYDEHMMSLHDSFNEAVAHYRKPSQELTLAFLSGDFREYIPSAYLPEYLDFEKYPHYTF